MLIVNQLLIGVVLPAAIALVALVVGWQPWRELDEEAGAARWRLAAAPLGVAGGYTATHVAIVGWPTIPPTNDLHWLAWAAVAAIVVGVVEAFADSTPVSWGLRVVLYAATLWLSLGFMVEHHWAVGQAVGWIGGATLLAVLATRALAATSRRHPDVSVPLVMTVAAAGAAVVLVLLGTAKMAQLLGALAATSGAWTVVTWWRGRMPAHRGGTTAFVALFYGALAYGYLSTADVPALGEALSDMPLMAVLLVAASPLALWAFRLPVVERLAGWKQVVGRGLAILILVASAAGMAASHSSAEQAEPPGGPDAPDIDYDALYGG